MSPKEDAPNRKEQIIEAAAALFAVNGYYKTTTADVAREVGVTQPYVFHFFKTKEALYLAVLEHATMRILHAFTTAEAPPDQLKKQMALAFNELLARHRNETLLVMTAFATPEPAVRDYVRQEFDRVYERVKARFEAAGLANADALASQFFAQGMLCTLAESINLPKLLPRDNW